MVLKSVYVLKHRDSDMFVKGLITLTDKLTDADQYYNRGLAYEMAGDTYDVMFYTIALEKDRF